MIKYLTKTAIGYSHIKEGRVCQDFSASYHDDERTIITACDGHGGEIYIRSHLGSKFASNAAISVLRRLSRSDFYRYTKEELCQNIRLKILCEWNESVENALEVRRISKRELNSLDKSKSFKLKKNPERAYGTTLNAAMIFMGKIVCVSIGDGGIFLIKKGQIIPAVDDDEDAVANVTYSLCQEDAYEHIKVKIYDFCDFDGVLVCTDGLINPYQSLPNFTENFVNPVCVRLHEGKYQEIDEFVELIGREYGIGDDVSLGIAMKNEISIRRYKKNGV